MNPNEKFGHKRGAAMGRQLEIDFAPDGAFDRELRRSANRGVVSRLTFALPNANEGVDYII
jgi:hypothetical protein